MKTVFSLDRNDPKAAVALYRESVLAGRWTSDDADTIFMLQDDPSALAELIAETNREPGFLDRLNAVLALDVV